MSDDSDMEDSVGWGDADPEIDELYLAAVPDIDVYENVNDSNSDQRGSNNENNGTLQQQGEEESVTPPPNVASHSSVSIRTYNMEGKRELTKSFLESYKKWKSYEEVLHTLEREVDPTSIEMNDVHRAMGYIRHLTKCEKKGMLPTSLPTMDDYKYEMRFKIRLGMCMSFKRRFGKLPGQADLDDNDSCTVHECNLIEFIEREKNGPYKSILVANGLLSENDVGELDDNNTGEEQKQQQGTREDDTKMQQNQVQVDSEKMESDNGDISDSKDDKKTKSHKIMSLEILMDNTSSGSEEKEFKLPSSVSLEKLQEVLFKPGRKFRGHIIVPGLGNAPDSLYDSDSDNDEDNNISENEDRDAELSNQVNSENNTSATSSNDEESSPRAGQTQEEEEKLNGKPYELVVTERGVDPLGNPFIAASHAAYGDEQHVRIQVTIKEEEGGELLWVDYSDGETCCLGYWNSEKLLFEGNVRQRMQANDGVFHTSAVTHVFTLYPCTSCFPTGRNEGKEILPDSIIDTVDDAKTNLLGDLLSRETAAIAAHRNRTYMALQICLHNFVVLVEVQPHMTTIDMHNLRLIVAGRDEADSDADEDIESRLDEKQQLIWRLRNVSFADLLSEAAKVGGEKLCADFRSRAALLDSMKFETNQDRLDFVTRWKEKKMDLKAAHDNWDTIEFVMKALAQMVYIFESSMGILLTFATHHRLHVSYECLEGAYRRAENRLPKDVLAKFEVSADQFFDNTVCIICQMPVLEDADGTLKEEGLSCIIYKFPCSHCFHKECAQQWLHNHSTCPSCRLDLTAKQTMNT